MHIYPVLVSRMNNIIGANNILDVMLILVIIIALVYTGTVYYIFIIIMLLLFLCVCVCVCNFIIICMTLCEEMHTHITTYEYNSQLTIFKNGHTTHQLLNVKALS